MTLAQNAKPYVYRMPATMPGQLLDDVAEPWCVWIGGQISYFATWPAAMAFVRVYLTAPPALLAPDLPRRVLASV